MDILKAKKNNNIKYRYNIFICLLVLIVSCQPPKNKLILGQWELHYEGSPHKMLMNFKNDTIVIVRVWDKDLLILIDSFSYKLVNRGKYLDFVPLSKRMLEWKNMEILELNKHILKIRSQSPDSSSLIFNRFQENK